MWFSTHVCPLNSVFSLPFVPTSDMLIHLINALLFSDVEHSPTEKDRELPRSPANSEGCCPPWCTRRHCEQEMTAYRKHGTSGEHVNAGVGWRECGSPYSEPCSVGVNSALQIRWEVVWSTARLTITRFLNIHKRDWYGRQGERLEGKKRKHACPNH